MNPNTLIHIQDDGLAPCPFCGKRPTLRGSEEESDVFYICENGLCSVRVHTCCQETEAAARAAWNTRAANEELYRLKRLLEMTKLQVVIERGNTAALVSALGLSSFEFGDLSGDCIVKAGNVIRRLKNFHTAVITALTLAEEEFFGEEK